MAANKEVKIQPSAPFKKKSPLFNWETRSGDTWEVVYLRRLFATYLPKNAVSEFRNAILPILCLFTFILNCCLTRMLSLLISERSASWTISRIFYSTCRITFWASLLINILNVEVSSILSLVKAYWMTDSVRSFNKDSASYCCSFLEFCKHWSFPTQITMKVV